MKRNNLVKLLALGCAVLPALQADDHDKHRLAPAVFAMTNAADQNQIAMYGRLPDGTLQLIDKVSTGGRGSGGTTDPLGSQGSLTLSQDHSLLFAVNAGSGTVSSFLVSDKLELRDVKSTEGSAPVAVAQSGRLVYVLNFAGNSNVVGFTVDDGKLMRIPNSIRYLTTANSGASSLAFSPDGRFLAVTEKLTNKIDIFPLMADGTLGTAVVYTDPTAGLFDVAFAPDGALLAVEAGAETISSFSVSSASILTPLSTAAATMGAASCWLATTSDGQYVYTSNAGSANLSGFAITGAGFLSPLTGTIVGMNPAGSTNIDIAIDGSNKYLYSLDSGTGLVSIFSILDGGALKLIGSVGGLTASSGLNGIAAL